MIRITCDNNNFIQPNLANKASGKNSASTLTGRNIGRHQNVNVQNYSKNEGKSQNRNLCNVDSVSVLKGRSENYRPIDKNNNRQLSNIGRHQNVNVQNYSKNEGKSQNRNFCNVDSVSVLKGRSEKYRPIDKNNNRQLSNIGRHQNVNVQNYSKNEGKSQNRNFCNVDSVSVLKGRSENYRPIDKNNNRQLSKNIDRNVGCNQNVNIQIYSINVNTSNNVNICNFNNASVFRGLTEQCRQIDKNNGGKQSLTMDRNTGCNRNVKSASNHKNYKFDSDSTLRGRAAQLRQINQNHGRELAKKDVHVLNKIIHNPSIGSNGKFGKDLSIIEKKLKK